MSDMINNVEHYSQAGAMLEPIDVINDGPFNLCNVIKYLSRAGHKDDELQDVLKAKRYITEAIKCYAHDPVPYDYWATRNLIYLKKLKPFSHLECVTAKKLIDDLKHMVRSRLMELEDK